MNGGGADDANLTNCILSANSANNGGGAFIDVRFDGINYLVNCSLLNNVASESGGGATGLNLQNCIVAGNADSVSGGGVDIHHLFHRYDSYKR
jgi:hypothetical protein